MAGCYCVQPFALGKLPMLDDLPSTPEEAIARGVNRYFTGLPCRNGHVAPRRVKDGYCMTCKRAAEQRRRLRRAFENIS